MKQIDIENVRCDYCWWYGYDDEHVFALDDESNEICVNCGNAGMLSNNTPVDLKEYPDFIEYMKNNKPKDFIFKDNYKKDDLEKYYQDAYPKYFKLHNTLQKYNL